MARKKLLFMAATTAIALLSGYIFRYPDTGTTITETSETGATSLPYFTEMTVEFRQIHEDAEPKPEPEPELDPEPEQKEKLLESVELDAETQWSIYTECRQNDKLFCTVMAIAAKETGYDTNAIGDGGNSIGMFQINTPWHSELIESLGITNLKDPAQGAKAAVSILAELTDTYGFEPSTHGQFMAYNMGANGARKAMEGGFSSTEYSREVMDFYQGYMKEMEVQE